MTTIIHYIAHCPVRRRKFESCEEETNYHLSKTDLRIIVGLSRNNAFVRELILSGADPVDFPEYNLVHIQRYVNEGTPDYDDPQYFNPMEEL